MTKPTLQPYPTYTRYYLGTIGLGMAVGIAWTLFFTGDYMQRHISKPHAISMLYVIVAVLMLAQAWMLRRWDKRLKRDRAMLDALLVEWKGELHENHHVE